MIFLGTRLYMEATDDEAKNANATALVLLNTRSIGGYKSVDEMVQNQEAQIQWGNQFGFLHVSLPELSQYEPSLNTLKFVHETQNVIKRKKNSAAVYLTGMLLESVRKYRGPEVHKYKYVCIIIVNNKLICSSYLYLKLFKLYLNIYDM